MDECDPFEGIFAFILCIILKKHTGSQNYERVEDRAIATTPGPIWVFKAN
jgi:hypothetical protein